ncbi:MAG: VWA domain-containing protein [Propionibacteriales bacterium]|nr:VWA domain-containing protein [Propionibacteriales bacterium]
MTADPRIATALTEVTRDLGPWSDEGECVKVAVTASGSGTTAAEIARPAGQGLAAALPDVWIPDSTLWVSIARASDVGAARTATKAVSVATSPVVIAMPRDRAESLGWPDAGPSWRELLGDNGSGLRLATTDPRVDAAGLASVLGILDDSSSTALVGVARRLRVPLLADRLAAQAVADGTVDAIPSTEQDVILANREADGREVVAAYDRSLRTSLDFPMVTVTPDDVETPSAETARATSVLREALLDPATQRLFSGAGLRGVSGDLPPGYGQRRGVLDVPLTTPPETRPADVSAIVDGWAAFGRRSNVLVVVDRSGSMSESLPGARTTKAELARAPLLGVVQGLAPDSEMGLWSFTTGLPNGDIEKSVPLGPVDEPIKGSVFETRRAALVSAVGGLDPVPGGGTPLYDSVLAAYRAALDDFSYGRLNAVIVVTDGRNADRRSITLPRLIDQLRVLYDGVRPVRIITLAYGADADLLTLRQIADITGGQSYRALTAQQVAAMFTSMLGDL